MDGLNELNGLNLTEKLKIQFSDDNDDLDELVELQRETNEKVQTFKNIVENNTIDCFNYQKHDGGKNTGS